MLNILTNSNKLDFIFKYNKCKSMEEIDSSLPTLIIGYNNAKKYIKNFNILNKAYPEQKLWWTFLKTEKRAEHDEDIANFSKILINEYIKNVKYSLIDIINLTFKDKKKILNYLMNSDDKKLIYNYFNKFLFVYSKKYQTVWGVALSTMRFCGIDTDKHLNRLYDNNNNTKITNLNELPFLIKKETDDNIPYQLALYEYFC